MVSLSIVFGVVLILLGVGGYVGTDTASVTALIPAAFGVLLLLLGLVGLREGIRRHAMHIAAALALLGFFGSADGIFAVGDMLFGTEVSRPVAALSKATMALLCLIFVVMATRSFVSAWRRSRSA